MKKQSTPTEIDQVNKRLSAGKVFATIKKATLSDEIYVALREGLMIGEWLPGAKITARNVAKQYKTSLSPARDAMTRLANEGGLLLSETRMYSVPQLTANDYMEVINIRLTLEPIAAEQAMTNITDNEIMELDQLNDDMRRLIENGQFREGLILDSRFHLDFYRLCNSSVLRQVIDNLWLRIGPTRNMLSQSYRRELAGYQHHKLILQALRDQDSTRVSKLISRDLKQGAIRIRKTLRETTVH